MAKYGLANHGILFTGGDSKPRTTTSRKVIFEAREEMNEKAGCKAWDIVEVNKFNKISKTY